MSTPRVSVIIPVHNSEKYLVPCLDSVLSQTERDIEVICVDDGSTDSSRDILLRFRTADSRIKLLVQANRGAGAARNLGMSHASGTYLSFLDSDDLFEPDMLEDGSNALDETGADIVAFGAWLYSTEMNLDRDAYWTLVTDNMPALESFNARDMTDTIFNTFGNYTWNKLFRRSFVHEANLFFQEISRTNDLLFVCRALVQAGAITVLDKKYPHYRVSESSLQSTNDRDPLAFFSAFSALQDWLKSQELYERFEYSFLKHALDGVVSNIDSLHTVEALNVVLHALSDKIEPRFGILEKADVYQFDPILLGIYRNALTMPTEDYLFARALQLRSDREMLYWETSAKTQTITLLNNELDNICASKAYRLGTSLAKPVRFIKNRSRLS